MPPSKKLLNLLDSLKAKYDVVKHKTVYTAYDLAQTLKKDLGGISKTLVVKADKVYVLVVVPASRRLDLKKLKKLLKAKKVEIAKEGVMKKVLKVKPGAITPFGKLYKDIPVYVDKTLLKAKKIIAGAGSYEESVEIKIKDFLKATEAEVGQFSEVIKRKVKKVKKTVKKKATIKIKKKLKKKKKKQC